MSWVLCLGATAITVIDIITYFTVEQGTQVVVNLIVSCIMFAVIAGLTVALLFLNVYIPTATGQWLRNAVNMIFRAPLQLLACGVLLWLPVLLALFYFEIFFYCIMIFVAAYFTLAVLFMTMLLKDTLIYYLLEARAQATLLGEDKDDEEI